MPQGDALESIVNLPVQLSELTQLITKVNEYKAAIIQANDALVSFKGGSPGSGSKANTDNLVAANNKLVESEKKVQAEKERTARQLEAVAARERKINADATNDYKQLSLAYNDAALKAKNYAIQLGLTHPQTQQAIANANAMNMQLRTLDASVGQYQRNVGNYGDKLGVLAKSLKGLGGLGIILSKTLGIDPEVFDGIRETGRALRDLHHAEDIEKLSTEGNAAAHKLTTVTMLSSSVAMSSTETAAQGAAGAELELAAATDVATVSMKAWRIALIGTGIGLLLVAIGYLIYKMTELSDAQKMANWQAEESLKISKAAAESAGKEIADLKIWRAEIENVNVPMKTRLQAIKDLKKEYPDLFDKYSTDILLNGKAAAAYDLAAAAIIRKAKAQAAASEIEKIETEKMNLMIEKQENSDKYVEMTKNRGKNSVTRILGSLAQDSYESANKNIQKEQDLLKKREAFIMQIVIEGADQTVKIEGEKGKKVNKQVKENFDACFAIYKSDQERFIRVLDDEASDESKTYEERFAALQQYLFNKQQLVTATQGNEQIKLTEELDKGNITQKTYEQKLLLLETESNNQRLDNEDEFRKKKDALAAKYNKEDVKQAKEAAGAVADATDKEQKYADEKAAAKKEARRRTEAEIEKATQAFFDGQFERQKNAIQDQKALLDKQSQDEIERITKSTLSEQDKANKIAIIQANAAAQKAQLDQKQKEIDYKKAQFDRFIAIADVIKDTARAVAADLAKNKFLIPFDIAIGAAQLAAILSHPIPKFAKGTGGSPEGLALTDEQGAEGYITPSGKAFIGNDKPTLRYLERGTKIIPHDELNRIMLNNMMRSTARMLEPKDNNKLEEVTMWQTQQIVSALKAQNKRPIINIKNDAGFQAYIKKQVFD